MLYLPCNKIIHGKGSILCFLSTRQNEISFQPLLMRGSLIVMWTAASDSPKNIVQNDNAAVDRTVDIN